ncbi:zinc finger protein RFP-like [Alligator mississippiensis]|uniref:Zinc finger protein RFP-like n=1 Tax=Alligator mississippiensis TaxID=8496 RepID=A0A151MYU4_ALLMI|nr:zinc finger protein RFP-like [Alligator mississippiensis]
MCREAAPKTNFRPNRELARVAEIAKQLSSQPAKGAGGGEALCTKHGEPLKLFCEEDQAPICVVCDRSKTHRAHNVVPIEEAAQEYMEQVQDRLQTLKEEREKLLRIQASTEGKFWRYLEKIETQKKRIASKFEAFHKFLQEQEQFLLAQLTELDKELQKLQKENVTKLSKEISHLNNLIKEVEQKCQHPASEFLQDIRNTLSRCEKGKIQQPVEVSPEFERRLQKLSQREVVGNKALRIMQDVLMNKQQKAVKVTLNPDTAHSHLVISEDRKNVRWAVARHHLPDTPQRFDSVPCVLGHEGFATGRHYWEVETPPLSDQLSSVPREALLQEIPIKNTGIIPRANITGKGPERRELCLKAGRKDNQTTAATSEDTTPELPGLSFQRSQQPWHQQFPNGTFKRKPNALSAWSISQTHCRTCFWKSHLRPNWDLANILEKIKQLSPYPEDTAVYKDGYKLGGQIQNLLQKRKKEKEKLLGLKLAEERKIQEYLEKRNGERQKIVSEFQQLCQLLDEQERLLLARMEELDKEVVKKQKENITKISEEFSRLGELIREMEGKCQQTASDLLQDIRSTLSRCGEGKCQQPEVTSPDLKNKLDFWCQKNTAVKEILGKVTETLLSELQKDWSRSLEKKTKPVYRKVKVTLDPDTAHPNLILSEDRRSVRRGTTRQVVAYNPERFYPIHCVLGCEVFTSGRYCWEVETRQLTGEGRSWEEKEKIQVRLQVLKDEREKLLGERQTEEERTQDFLEELETEKVKIVCEIEELHHFMHEQERLLVARLDALQEKIVRRRDERVAQFSEDIAHLDDLITEVVEKCQQPAVEFLQDCRSILSRWEEKIPEPLETSLELEEKINSFSQANIDLEEVRRDFQVNLTLDPETAHPRLVLSEDGKDVRWEDTRRHVPDNPKRFDSSRCKIQQ